MTLDPAFLLEQILSEKAARIAFQPIVDLSDGSFSVTRPLPGEREPWTISEQGTPGSGS